MFCEEEICRNKEIVRNKKENKKIRWEIVKELGRIKINKSDKNRKQGVK